jgi:hypothetical protein
MPPRRGLAGILPEILQATISGVLAKTTIAISLPTTGSILDGMQDVRYIFAEQLVLRRMYFQTLPCALTGWSVS